ncbi:hypothetical protein FB565_006398 [Actinoplanes lutulentus]|uniref:Uncharacterized protein n=1 Tax=Actinoplanes lutulentus TaxID=1287878 RepID=A0A327YZI8_9ACTN|nr:hypothetical protein [Actinoplanes lutulentus]MBB2946630.1 hypothetical protein [Actinoplanes lutulentus]RAK26548.1 hypothetical protein B0I29_127138 [Actinoplanes lutulentus]
MTHRQRFSTILVVLLAALGFAAVGTSPATAAPAAPTTQAAVIPGVPVTGTFTDATGGAGTFAGTFTPESFSAQDGGLLAAGTLTGALTDSSGDTVGTVDQPVSMPAAVAQATCRVLDLTLGPLHLDVLGLVVDLNQVHLTITAQSAPGNLLGNLLCAITHLLDQNPSAGTLAAILNFLLALLAQS